MLYNLIFYLWILQRHGIFNIMRLIVLITCVISFVASFAGVEHSHASETPHQCASFNHGHSQEHSHGHSDCEDDGMHNQGEEKGPCECCKHCHCAALPFSQTKLDNTPNSKEQLSWYSDSHYSTDLSRLKRPPRV